MGHNGHQPLGILYMFSGIVLEIDGIIDKTDFHGSSPFWHNQPSFNNNNCYAQQ
jgi:hypothetical protein